MKLLRIKWELISAIIIGILFSYCIIVHIIVNGLDFESFVSELIIYGLVFFLNYYAILSLRKELLSK